MKQEHFGELLAATMSRFFSLHFNGEWRVAWNGEAAQSGSQRWLVNSLINAVFVPGVHRCALDVVRREFGTSVVRWKRPLQRGYFRLATSGTAGLMAHASLTVHPAVPHPDCWLIVPGMNKVRFINSAAGISYCCRKPGCDPAHFRRETEARQFAERHGVPVPRILEFLSDDCLAETMIVGTPLNRLISLGEQGDGLRLAFDAIERLYSSSRRMANLGEYCADIVSQIESVADALSTVARTEVVALAKRVCEFCAGSGESIELVRSHGDFQPGNILYDGRRIWLIDWEFSGERSQPFDRLTYELRTRFDPGLAGRVLRYAAGCGDDRSRRELRVFVLETILFECDKAMAAPCAVPRSLVATLGELEKTLPALRLQSGT